jgi:hypothetical protein
LALLLSDPYRALMDDAVSGRYIGLDWIEDNAHALPCRFVITSKKERAAPQFIVATDNWSREPSLPPDTFAFTPPKGAVKINFVKVAEIATKQSKQGRQ